MIAYKLEWTTQKETGGSLSLINKYINVNRMELYTKKDKAEVKKKQLEDSAQVLGFVGLNVWITEIEIIE